MFKVFKKDNVSYESFEVYAIRDDKNGYPHFLIYEDGEWKYVSAKYFAPIISEDV